MIFSRLPVDNIGALAEFVAVDAAACAPLPQGLSAPDAASLPLVTLTAMQALQEMAHVKSGDTVFIQGGTGGLGSIAVQLAKALGATVATTVSTPNVALAKKLGADIVVDYKTQRYEDYVHDIDVVLDTLGGEETFRSMQLLKPGGTLVSVVSAPDVDFATQLGKPVLKPMMWWMSRKQRAAAYRFLFMRADGEQLKAVTPYFEDGTITPLVREVFPFDQLDEAFALLTSGRAKPGKIVVTLK